MSVDEMSVQFCMAKRKLYAFIETSALTLLHLQVPSDGKLPFRTVQYA